jgi:hypothetical protein
MMTEQFQDYQPVAAVFSILAGISPVQKSSFSAGRTLDQKIAFIMNLLKIGIHITSRWFFIRQEKSK